MTRRDYIKTVIQEACMQWADTRGEVPLPSMPEKSKNEFVKYLRRWYPFGERKHWPYKVWLSEVAAVRKWLFSKPLPNQESLPLDEGLFAGLATE